VVVEGTVSLRAGAKVAIETPGAALRHAAGAPN
jgi:hypothetical protein